MNSLFRFFCVFLLCIIPSYGVNAAGNVYWSDFNITAEYDESDEEMLVKFSVFSDGDPRQDYTIDLDLWDESCDIDLNYKSFYLTGECEIDIKYEDVLGEYVAEFEALDEDDGEEYNGRETLEIEWLEDDLDWDALKSEAEYIEDDEELTLKLYLEDVERQPSGDYEITIELENKVYKEDFSYSKTDSELAAEFEIKIDEEDSEENYSVDLEIVENDEDEEVADDKISVDVNIVSNDDDFDWNEIEYSSYYDEDREDIIIEFTLEDIKNDPNDSYKIYVELDWEEEDENMRYDEDEEILYAEVKFWVDEDDLDDNYDVEFYIENKDTDDEEYEDDFEIEDIWDTSSSDDIDWDDLEISLLYDEDEEVLYAVFELELSSDPREDFDLVFELDGEDYEEELEYDSDKESLFLEVEIDIDEDDIEDEYEVDYEINDEDDDEVADEKEDIDVEDYEEDADKGEDEDENEESNKIDSDWEGLSVSMQYNENSNLMLVTFVLEDAPSDSDDRYDIEFTIADDYDVSWELKYDEDDEEIKNFFYLNIDKEDVEDAIKIDIVIEDGDNESVYDATLLYDLEKEEVIDEDDSDEESETSTDLTDERKEVIERVLEKYTDSIFKRYTRTDKAIRYLELMIILFEDYGNKKAEHKEVLDFCVEILEEIISERK